MFLVNTNHDISIKMWVINEEGEHDNKVEKDCGEIGGGKVKQEDPLEHYFNLKKDHICKCKKVEAD